MGARFTNLKIKSFAEGKVGRYILYAIGEIILVVVGILIALSINNRNELKKQSQTLDGILKNVKYNLEDDSTRVNLAIAYYESREKFTNKIINNEFTEQDYKTCLMCPSVLVLVVPVDINDKGYLQLKNYQSSVSEKDSLSVDVVQFYKNMNSEIDAIGTEVKASTIDNLKHWRDNYDWFPNIMAQKGDPRFIEYITHSQDFKNRIAYYNAISCKSYLHILRKYKKNSKRLLERIDKRFESESN